MPTRTFVKIFGITIVLLLIPFVSSLFNDQIDWDILHYFVMGSIIFTAISLFLYQKKIQKFKSSYWIGIFILVIFLLLWDELAVGIFNTLFAGS